MRQEAPAASVPPQGLVDVTMAKSAAFVPPRRMLLMFSVALPVLESVAVRLAEVTFCVVFGKVMVEVSDATGAETPVPVPCSSTICGVPTVFVGTERYALRAPAPPGVKVTPSLQVFPAVSE
jgi:hypothetical protein